jgi:hypothetical protein
MIIVAHGTVVTEDDAGHVYPGGHVVLDGDRIAAVGPGPYPGLVQDGDQVIDAAGMAVLPGLIDLHFHTAVGKGYCDHLPLWESLEQFWYPSIRALDAETAYWAAAASYAESIKCGVTTVNDMYRRLPDLARAAADIGIRAVLSNDVALDEHRLDTLQDNKDAFDAVHGLGDGRVEVRVGIEWLPLASPGLRRRPLRLAVRPGAGHDARDRHPHRALPVQQRQAGQRHRPGPGDAGRRDQRRARPRRRRIHQQLRPVPGDEVRLADPPGGPGRRQPAAGPGRADDGDPERRGRARPRHRPAAGGAKAGLARVLDRIGS